MNIINCVLLIEDDYITNFINERLISKLKISNKIVKTQNGQEALDVLKQHISAFKEYPQLIFLDINMPVMDGFEFLKRFHELSPDPEDTIIVMLTTSTHIDDMDNLLHAGNTDFLSKPLTEEKILSLMNKYFINRKFNQSA
jgi:CheY-like chemotaxis protein